MLNADFILSKDIRYYNTSFYASDIFFTNGYDPCDLHTISIILDSVDSSRKKGNLTVSKLNLEKSDYLRYCKEKGIEQDMESSFRGFIEDHELEYLIIPELLKERLDPEQFGYDSLVQERDLILFVKK